jgi:glycosyltransferase involved in cell wall biosynthesis
MLTDLGPGDKGLSSTAGIESGPHVCIGMPVFNEEHFIGAAVESLLAQTFEDFELFIIDNASTDRTEEICQKFAVADSRVRYLRNESNLGAAANFARALEFASGRYFLWAGGHDLWDSELVARSVAVLEERPEAVIALAECRWIDRSGDPLLRRSGHTDTSGMSSVERFFTVLWGNMHPILGLIRSDALSRTRGVQECMGADLLLLCELALHGDFVSVPGTWWYRREIRPQETYSEMVRRHRSREYRLSSGIAARVPLMILGSRLIQIAWRAPVPFFDRFVVCAGLVGMMPARYVGARIRRQ